MSSELIYASAEDAVEMEDDGESSTVKVLVSDPEENERTLWVWTTLIHDVALLYLYIFLVAISFDRKKTGCGYRTSHTLCQASARMFDRMGRLQSALTLSRMPWLSEPTSRMGKGRLELGLVTLENIEAGTSLDFPVRGDWE